MNINKDLNKITNYIEEHIFEDITIHQLGRLVGVTGYVLNYIFSALTGFSISTYIKRRRLTIAYNLLKSNKVIDVAFMCGYNSLQSFSRAFKKFHMFLPSQVLQNNCPTIQFKINFNEEDITTCFNSSYCTLENQTFWGEKVFISYKDNISKKIRFFWQKQLEQNTALLESSTRYGLILYKENGFDYFIALQSPYNKNCEIINIKKQQYIKIKLKNYLAYKIDQYAKELKDSFCVNQNATDIEIYEGRDVFLLFGIS